MIDKRIPYPILYLLTCDGQCQAWIGYQPAGQGSARIYYHTAWQPQEELNLELRGLDTDAAYEGNLILPNAVTDGFAKLLADYGLRHIRFHDLRHPYVKHTTKNIILKSRNPKLPRKLLQLGISAFVIL